MREELEDHGVEPDFTPVYTVMGLPLGIALDLAWCMEHGDDPCEE